MKVAIELTDKSSLKICGLTVLERIILTAKKSGVKLAAPGEKDVLRIKADRIIHPEFFETCHPEPLGEGSPVNNLEYRSSALAQDDKKSAQNDKVFEIKNATDIRKAERLLLKWCRKPTDGIISRHFNRFISTHISRYLVRLPLMPNHMTYFTFVIGLVSALLALEAQFFWAFIFFQIASILDGCDGEIAKLKLCQSSFGASLDTVSDNVTYLLFIISYGWGLSQYYNQPVFLYLSIASCASIGGALICMNSYLDQLKQDKTLVLVERVVHDLGKRKKIFLNFLPHYFSFMMKRDFFAFFFMILAFLQQWKMIMSLVFVGSFFVLFYSFLLLKKTQGNLIEERT